MSFYVIKRNDKKEEYNKSKVERAVFKAAVEHEDEEVATDIALQTLEPIEEQLGMYLEVNNTNSIPVDEVQNAVEFVLMENQLFDIAKSYILYRYNRDKSRKNRKEGILSSEFLSKYKHQANPFPTELGEFIYYRTYSRWLEEEQRREYWWETVKRAVEYNCSLSPTTKKEAEELYDNVYHLRNFLAGRTLWTASTESSKKYGMSNYNCSFTVIDSLKAYQDIFYLLMIGSGTGFRVLPRDVEKLPKIRTDVEVIHKYYEPVEKEERREYTDFSFDDSVATINVGDSKEGWIQALEYYLKFLTEHSYRPVNKVIINYDSVRPKGEKLKTFGGTASGHQSLKTMFTKIDKLLNKKTDVDDLKRAKLKPIDAMDIANIIAENVVSGGVRRSSQICLFSADDKEIAQAKSNLYKQVDGEWVIDKEIAHRQMSNNSIFYEEKPSREQLKWHVKQMEFSGEPGFINAVEGKRRREDFKGVNPCFTGDTKLLTNTGYKRLDELAKLDSFDIINKNGNVTKGKAWSNGVKDIVSVNFFHKDKKSIRCTPDHVFMNNRGEEIEAKDLQNQRVMPFISLNDVEDSEYVKLGFIQGDGNLTRLKNDTHKGIEINIGSKDVDVRELFGENNINGIDSRGRTIYTTDYTQQLEELEFSSETLPNRTLPNTFSDWTSLEKLSFLKGLYSANGSVIGYSGNGRITLKSTNFDLVSEVKKELSSLLGIESYITRNKKKMNEFSNGTYEMKESYDLNISNYLDKIKFYNNIGFIHEYKNEKLKNYLIEKAPKVSSVTPAGKEEVFDFTEPGVHWGVIEGLIAHNCAEILLDSKGVCNLTSLNVMSFVEDGKLNKEAMFRAQELSARAGYRMATIEFELPEWGYINDRDRLIGMSITGWQDMANAIGLTKEGEAELLSELKDVAHRAAKEIADELGGNEPKLITTVKPEGTQTQMPTVSSGLHYSHSPYYYRRVRISADDALVKVAEELDWNVYPEVGQDEETCQTKVIEFPVKAPEGKVKADVNAIEQLETYKMFMDNYVDHNASITVHVKEDEWEDVEKWLWENWDSVVGISFLSYSDSFYELMPYQEVTEREYKELQSQMKAFNPYLVNKYEKEMVEEREIDDSSCESGACPIR